jgi:hypothetical protein
MLQIFLYWTSHDHKYCQECKVPKDQRPKATQNYCCHLVVVVVVFMHVSSFCHSSSLAFNLVQNLLLPSCGLWPQGKSLFIIAGGNRLVTASCASAVLYFQSSLFFPDSQLARYINKIGLPTPFYTCSVTE